MSDLVKRLREPIKPEYEEKLNHTARRYNIQRWEAADRIEELERELAEWRKQCLEAEYNEAELQRMLSAEKALVDRLGRAITDGTFEGIISAEYIYRKARGL